MKKQKQREGRNLLGLLTATGAAGADLRVRSLPRPLERVLCDTPGMELFRSFPSVNDSLWVTGSSDDSSRMPRPSETPEPSDFLVSPPTCVQFKNMFS